jgi:ethanolamine permease
MDTQKATLQRSLTPLMLWGLGVGYVISGMYFGWNLGLAEGGTLGMAIATVVVAVMYITFTLGYTELACAIPKAGGAFDYADRALGKRLGFLGGVAQIIEFVFAPPAIAYAIGAYVHLFLPAVPVIAIAMLAYLVFTTINILGVRMAASFELVVTLIAVIELLVFAAAAMPHIELVNLTHNALPNGWMGVFAATPFAIWFFLAIEGLANVAEETINPQRNMIVGFGAAMATLLLLCLLTFVSAVGVGGWEGAVFDAAGNKSDSPLPLVMSHAVGTGHWLYKIVGGVGLFGLVASFHGIILAAGRATFEFGRVRYIPSVFGNVHPKFRTPANALLVNMVVGMVALLTNRTGDIIILSCFGALTLYAVAMCSLFALRRNEPLLPRPFKTPFYPFFPAIALLIALVSLLALTYYNPKLAGIYALMVGVGYVYYVLRDVEDR